MRPKAYGSTRAAIVRAVMHDFNLHGSLGRQVAEAAEYVISEGYYLFADLRNKYDDLLCPWCGRPHHEQICDLMLEYTNSHAECSMQDASDYALIHVTEPKDKKLRIKSIPTVETTDASHIK